MPTQHLHRIVCIAAEARCATINTAIKNNLDPDGGDWLSVRLSASGNLPATHWAFSAQLTNAGVLWVLNRWYALAAMTPPAWGTLTRAQIRSRLATDRTALVAASQVRMFHCDNDGVWDQPGELLAAIGLQVI